MADKEFLKGILVGDGWDQADTLCFQYYNVRFLVDWGPFDKDDTFSCLTIDYDKQVIEVYSKDGTYVQKSLSFKLVPADAWVA